MRWKFMMLSWCALIPAAVGQTQDDKLVGRLLRPNLSKTNVAQTERFETKGRAFEKDFSTKTFALSEPTISRQAFDSNRTIAPGDFAVRHFRTGPSSTEQKKPLLESATVEVFSSASSSRAAWENSIAPNRLPDAFRGSRSFAIKGKSQKALHAYDRALTIEEVRELLNKNK